jgi:hypothetical protein
LNQIVIKTPTIQLINKANQYKGRLIPMNHSDLFSAHELEQKAMEYGVLRPEDLIRKKDIEQALKFGFYNNRVTQPIISESSINQCYDIIQNGFVLLDLDKPLIFGFRTADTRPQDELDLIKELIEIKAKIGYFYEYSLEAYQSRMFNYFLLSECVYNKNLKKVFKSIEDIMSLDLYVINTITERFIEFKNYIPEFIFRMMARGDCEAGRDWLYNYSVLDKINYQIFDELDYNKITLIKWTLQYQNIRESYEPPTDEVIANDSELDNWLFNKKLEKGNRKSLSEGNVTFTNKNAEPSYVSPNAMTFEGG